MTNNILEGFERYLVRHKKSSGNTVRAYVKDISRFYAYVNCDASDLSAGKIEEYIALLKNSGKSKSTIRRFVAALKIHCCFLDEINIDCAACAGALRPPAPQNRLPGILSVSEVDILLSLPDSSCAKGLRDKAMLELLYAAGLKINQLVSLNVTDVNAALGLVNRAEHPAITLHPSSQKALLRYVLEGRPQLMKHAEQPALFLNQSGERLSRQGFWKILKGYQQSAGIDMEISPHTLRHSVAVHLLQNGADTAYIRQLLGLSSPSSVKMYTKIARSMIKNDSGKYHPKA